MKENRTVGIPAPRVEGEDKVSGRAIYAVDIRLPGMLWVKVLRSPISHGRIKGIDTQRAMRLPGVKAVITGQDVAGARIGTESPGHQEPWCPPAYDPIALTDCPLNMPTVSMVQFSSDNVSLNVCKVVSKVKDCFSNGGVYDTDAP